MKVFITGVAGMIGYHFSLHMKKQGYDVWGIDNFNDYYDPNLKQDRADILENHGIVVYRADLMTANYALYLGAHQPDIVVHLAAHAGVRHSIEYPQLYIDNNITGTQRLVEACEKYECNNVIYASTSCVMHGQQLPWKEDNPLYHQKNPYGWSKQINECQFLNSKIQRTAGMRFFTVYGPYGRPDMGLSLFTDGIQNGKTITVYNHGDMQRDFTYVEDICQGVRLVSEKMMCEQDQRWDEIFNIGYGNPVQLMDFIHEIERCLGKKAKIDFQPIHPADSHKTWADISKIKKLGYQSTTPVSVGVATFVDWWLRYYGIFDNKSTSN